jgi:glycosyltransferase involved in cell wall biosynthesis
LGEYLHWLAWRNSYLIVEHSRPEEVERIANKEAFPLSRMVIYVGVALDPRVFYPVDMMEARSKLRLPKQSYIILFTASGGGAGNYNYELMPLAFKNLIKKYPDSLLIIAGDIHPLYKKPFLKLVEEEGLTGRVIITGYLSQEILNLYINASDVCLLPLTRRHLERNKISWSTKLWEYFGCAKPVVKSDLEECWTYDWFKDISLIVPPDDEESLAQALIQLYENPSLRKELGEKAYKWTLENHTWDKRAEKIERFLTGLVKERK